MRKFDMHVDTNLKGTNSSCSSVDFLFCANVPRKVIPVRDNEPYGLGTNWDEELSENQQRGIHKLPNGHYEMPLRTSRAA